MVIMVIIQRFKLKEVDNQIENLENQLAIQIKNNEQLIKIIKNINNADYYKTFSDGSNGFEVKFQNKLLSRLERTKFENLCESKIQI